MTEPNTTHCTTSDVRHECEPHGPIYYGEGYGPQPTVQAEIAEPDRKDASRNLKILAGSVATAGALGEAGASAALVIHESFIAAGACSAGAVAAAAFAAGSFMSSRRSKLSTNMS